MRTGPPSSCLTDFSFRQDVSGVRHLRERFTCPDWFPRNLRHCGRRARSYQCASEEGDLPVGGVGEIAPEVDEEAEFVDYRRGIVALLFGGDADFVAEAQRFLGGGGFAFAGLGDGGDEFGLATGGDDFLGGLAGFV